MDPPAAAGRETKPPRIPPGPNPAVASFLHLLLRCVVGSADALCSPVVDVPGRAAGRDYVQREGFSGMADDLTNLVRRNPLPALFIGFGLGFLLARSMRD